MRVSKEELIAVLAQFNPWWRGEPIADLSSWRRAAWRELHRWVSNPPAHRAILVSGARQVGKTTLLLQQIDALLEQGVSPANILYATFDHPVLKLAGGALPVPRRNAFLEVFVQHLGDRIALQRPVDPGAHQFGILALEFSWLETECTRDRFTEPFEVGHALLATQCHRR